MSCGLIGFRSAYLDAKYTEYVLWPRTILMAYRIPGEFRHAQLQAKRNAELAQRKERELLFSRPQSPPTNQQKSSDKFTQNDLVRNASSDVTAALRRTHNLMRTELSRSTFAQETLG